MPGPSDPTPERTIHGDVEHFGSELSPAEAADETKLNDVKHFGCEDLHADEEKETKRNDAERCGCPPPPSEVPSSKGDLVLSSGPHSPLTTTSHRTPLTTTAHQYRSPSGITPVDLSKLPRTPPDLPDGVLPYVEYLCERQKSAIELLLAGDRPGVAAEKLGIGRTTLWRWRKYDIHFRRALAAARWAAFGEAVERLRGLVPEAVDVLHARMNEGSDLAATRLLRLARVDQFQPDLEQEREPPRLAYEPLYD